MRSRALSAALVAIFGWFLTMSWQGVAQDRRHVIEPHIPPVCTTLSAQLLSTGSSLGEADEGRLDTARIQAALNGCAPGKAVELAGGHAHDAFLSGPLSLPAGVTLLIDRGVTLFASRDPELFNRAPGSCGLVNDQPPGCKPLLSVANAPHAAVMGDGVIDGRGGFTLLHRTVTWWQLAEQARAGGRQQVPRLIVVDHSDDFTLYRTTLKNSPNFHVTFANGSGFTAWGVRIDTPRNARNTDGIDPGGSASDITIAHSFISTGDDHVAIKGSGSGVQHVSILASHFYFGHGMSIGSETFGGVSDAVVRDLTLDGADNGLRIKSNIHRGGLVQRITYSDVCIRDTRLPLTFDTRYDNPGPDSALIPEFRDIVVRDVHVKAGGKIVVDGWDPNHLTRIRFDGVSLDQASSYTFFAKDASLAYGPQPVTFRLQGENVTTDNQTSAKEAHARSDDLCSARFTPFPR